MRWKHWGESGERAIVVVIVLESRFGMQRFSWLF